jgi:hypothetical protein
MGNDLVIIDMSDSGATGLSFVLTAFLVGYSINGVHAHCSAMDSVSTNTSCYHILSLLRLCIIEHLRGPSSSHTDGRSDLAEIDLDQVGAQGHARGTSRSNVDPGSGSYCTSE